MILTTPASGPWILIDPPFGIDHLEANVKANRSRISEIQIEKGAKKMVSVHMDSFLKGEQRVSQIQIPSGLNILRTQG